MMSQYWENGNIKQKYLKNSDCVREYYETGEVEAEYQYRYPETRSEW
jgi:antitoxin component YwqK of YwqJK toxin-antitoxin module